MRRRTRFIAVLPTDRTKDNKITSLAWTAASLTGDIALGQAADEDDFCAFKNDHISLA